MFERPNFSDPAFEPHVWYFNAYKDALVPLCRGRVLDIGAGHGYLSREVAEREDVISVLATDRHYDSKLAQVHPKLRLLTMETEMLISRNDLGLFDTIIATEHVEHLPERSHVSFLAFVRKHLKPGGWFLGSMPDVSKSGNPFHLKEYRADEWRAMLERCCFKNFELWHPTELLYCWKAQ